jgi:thiol:disulfide interchange protein
MKRSIAALCVLVALAAAIVHARDVARPAESAREQTRGPSADHRSTKDLQLEQAIERARQRQALVDDLADRLTPEGS